MKTIILVDDTPDLLILLKKIIERSPIFSVIATEFNAADAYESILNLHPDLILVDLSMPGEDGISLISRLLKAGYHGKIGILSGHPINSVTNRLEDIKYNWYFEKGISVNNMLNIIEQSYE